MNEDRIQECPSETGAVSLPASESDGGGEAIPDIRKDEPTAMQVFLAWEKLRIVYNLALLLVVLCMAVLQHKEIAGALDSIIESLPYLLFNASGVNLLYCVGVVAEGYLSLIRVPRMVARPVLFGLGLMIGIGGAAEAARHLPQLLP